MGGDFRYFWPENIEFFARLPSSWDASLNTGIGMPAVNTLWISSFFNLTASLSQLGLSWNLISLITWIFPFLFIAFFSTYYLFKTQINKSRLYAVLAGIIYTTNTYFLLMFFGGQVGVCFAYALIPLALLTFIKLVQKSNLYSALLFGLVFSFELLFDPRYAYLSLIILAIYYLLQFKYSFKDLLYLAIIPGIVVFLLHSFWLLPLLIYKSTNIIPTGFETGASVNFFSFAEIENTLSLLHPNWPENLFGKVYFMRPEFLVFPILAFSSLLFINIKNKLQNILFFMLLGLMGAFLAKGTNEPFGNVFLFLFDHVPGLSLFRDPTKFYVFVAVSYSMLIPFVLSQFAKIINSKFKIKNFNSLIVLVFILFWILSLRLLFTSDAFRIHRPTQSYVELKDFIVSQNQFFRTLWIPKWQRYGYFSDINPAIGRGELFKEASTTGMIKELKTETKIDALKDMGVKYVIIPEDSEGEMFLNDRKYDEKVYQKTLAEVEKLGLTEVKTFGKTVVFEIPNYRERFWSPTSEVEIKYELVKPTHYNVTVKKAKKGDLLVFSDSYSKYWIAQNLEFRVQSVEFKNNLNSFVLPKNGDYKFTVYYQPQRLVHIGLIISIVIFSMLLIYLWRNKKR